MFHQANLRQICNHVTGIKSTICYCRVMTKKLVFLIIWFRTNKCTHCSFGKMLMFGPLKYVCNLVNINWKVLRVLLRWWPPLTQFDLWLIWCHISLIERRRRERWPAETRTENKMKEKNTEKTRDGSKFVKLHLYHDKLTSHIVQVLLIYMQISNNKTNITSNWCHVVLEVKQQEVIGGFGAACF